MRPELVAELTSALANSDRAIGVKAVLDDFFLRHMAIPHRDEPRIDKVMSLIEDETTTDLATAAAAYGIGPRTAGRLSRHYFGFPPKMLMMRARFLRTIIPMLDRDPADAERVVPTEYFDQSHFIRDAQRFLGMTPRQFIMLKSPYAAAARRARRAVIGAPVPPLDRLRRALPRPPRPGHHQDQHRQHRQHQRCADRQAEMIAVASGFCSPDPRPIPSASGASVRIAINADITIGLSRA